MSNPSLTPSQRLRQNYRQWTLALKQFGAALRVAMPGTINSFDPDAQTVTVQLGLREQVRVNGSPESLEIPLLLDVPIVLPRGGGFSATFPIQQGDECLVVFGDVSMDAWWQSGGVQERFHPRRHSLSDGFAILGPWSQPRVLEDYSTTSMQLRSDDGQTVIDVASGQVTITANTVQVTAQNVTVAASQAAQVTGQTVNVNGSESVTINGAGHTQIDGVNWLQHTHSAVSPGSGVSGPVVP